MFSVSHWAMREKKCVCIRARPIYIIMSSREMPLAKAAFVESKRCSQERIADTKIYFYID